MTPTPRHRLRLAVGLLAALALVAGLAACGSDSDGDESSSDTTVATASTDTTAAPADGVVSDEDGLTIANPWARTSPMDTTYGAVYVELTSADGDALVSAGVPADIAATVEIHETVPADESSSDTTMGMGGGTDTSDTTGPAGMGQMTMQPVDSVDLPAGETVALEPGGFHIMLIDLVAPLETGQEIEVTLTFENAGERTITVPVRDDAP